MTSLQDSVGVVELELILNYELFMQDCLGGVVPVEFYWQFMMVWWGTVEMIKSFLYCILFTLLHKLFVAKISQKPKILYNYFQLCLWQPLQFKEIGKLKD
jgi:hypothetical protein